MKRMRAFTLIDALCIMLVVLVLLVAVAVIGPGLAASHYGDNMKNATQLKGMMTAFIAWSDANSNKTPTPNAATQPAPGDFPGGITAATGNYPANATEPSVVGRLWALVAAPGTGPLNPKMLVNPAQGVPETVWSTPPHVSIAPGVTTAATAHFGSNNVSYGLLSTKMGSEWRNKLNAGCPMICDRNRGTPVAPSSSWSTWYNPTWQGNVAWGDCHVTWETSPIFGVTIYGNTSTTSNLWAPGTSSNAGMVNPGE
jgi:hypothetical protein